MAVALLLLLVLLAALLRMDPVRTGAGLLLLWGGCRLLLPAPGGAAARSLPGRWTLFGSVQRMREPYVLEGYALACGLADVKMDLSQAIVPDGEHVIAVRAVLGDVLLYLPDDLPAEVVAEVGAGSLSVPGESRTGLALRAVYTSEGFGEAAARVRVVVALGGGDVDVRRI